LQNECDDELTASLFAGTFAPPRIVTKYFGKKGNLELALIAQENEVVSDC
jgi:hypothetical protein